MIENVTKIQDLRQRLDLVNRRWNAGHYRNLMDFFVQILPRIMDCERCSIFRVDPGGGAIESFVGTGLDRDVVLRPPADAIVSQVIQTGVPITDNDIHRRQGYHREAAKITGFVTRNIQTVPLRSPTDGSIVGALQILNRHQGGFDEDDRIALEDIADFLSMTLENVMLNDKLLAVAEGLQNEIAELRGLMTKGFIATSPAMQPVVEQVEAVAKTPVNILLTGEIGTDKEQVARLIHHLRAGTQLNRPFVTLNCAALPEEMMALELFGYEQDAQGEGTSTARPGRFEQAHGGTLYLEDIADFPMALQQQLLRVLQEQEGARIGDERMRPYDVRLISATDQDLRLLVEEGRFDEDLYYHLFSVEIPIPPLRERHEDIALLASNMCQEISKYFGKHIQGLSPRVLASFERYDWPGNNRQLRSEVERLVALTPDGHEAQSRHCSEPLREIAVELPEENYPEQQQTVMVPTREISSAENLPEQVAALERQMIIEAMNLTSGNKTAAADMLCITRQGLHNKLRRYNLNEQHAPNWRHWTAE